MKMKGFEPGAGYGSKDVRYPFAEFQRKGLPPDRISGMMDAVLRSTGEEEIGEIVRKHVGFELARNFSRSLPFHMVIRGVMSKEDREEVAKTICNAIELKFAADVALSGIAAGESMSEAMLAKARIERDQMKTALAILIGEIESGVLTFKTEPMGHIFTYSKDDKPFLRRMLKILEEGAAGAH